MSQIKSMLRQARRTLANSWLNDFHPRTVQIAITGSYGKTSTTHAIHAICTSHGDTLVTDVNLDTIYNIPITALRLRNHTYAVFETGIDTRNEMSLHLEILQPDISLITGIAPVHADADHLGSLENIITEKRKLIEVLTADQYAILNYDNPYVREMAAHTSGQVIWYGLSPGSDYSARAVKVGLHGLEFIASTPEGNFRIETPLIGRHSAANLMAAVAVGRLLGIPMEQMQAVFRTLRPLKGRLNVEDGPLGTALINDALRANTASTKAGLRYLSDIKTAGQKVAVVGEMGEIGETAVEEHAAVGELLTTLDIDLTLCVGGLTTHIADAAADPQRVMYVDTVQQAANILSQRLKAGDILYIKGSLHKHLERVKLLLRGVEVGCTVLSCPFYHQCDVCDYRESGYQEVAHAPHT